MVDIYSGSFVWDAAKELTNFWKHGIDFRSAVLVFRDPKRLMLFDSLHSKKESRFFCIGMVKGRVLTVRFTYCQGRIRIIGAGSWRKWRRFYEENTQENG